MTNPTTEPQTVGELAEQILADQPPNLREVTVEERDSDQFDASAWREERTRAVLARRIPAEFQDATVADDQPEVRAWIERFVADPRSVRALVLLGYPGTGKTHTAYGVVREAALAFEKRHRRAMSWRFRTHVQLAGDVMPKPEDEHLVAIHRYKTEDLLVIDDLTSARISEWGAEVLLDIIDTRWAEHRAMIITANADADHLDAAVGERIASRLADSVRVGFDGPDRRGGDAR